MLLLAIDTSTPTVTAGVVSLLRPHELIGADGLRSSPVELLAQRSVTDAFAHAEQLMPLVQAALTDSGHLLADVEAIVVGLGPGPFTGLRVGIATAQALGDALDLPVHGVDSHDGAARARLQDASGPPAGPFLVVTDARRREVYLSGFAADGRRLLGPLPIAPAAVPALLAEQEVQPTELIGAGASLVVPVLDVPVADVSGLSAGLVLAAARPLLTAAVPGPLTPLYLRRPDATEPTARKSVLGR